MSWAFVPLDPPGEIDLATLAPLVAELVRWLGPGEWPPTLVGLVRCAPAGLLDDARAELAGARGVPIPWTLNGIVRHALIPLAGLSLVDGQPVIPELGAALVDVLGDPRLGPSQRREVERALLESEDLAGGARHRSHGPRVSGLAAARMEADLIGLADAGSVCRAATPGEGREAVTIARIDLALAASDSTTQERVEPGSDERGRSMVVGGSCPTARPRN